MSPKDLSLNEKVLQLKGVVQDVIAEEEKLNSEIYLYHWLRGNKFDVKKAEKAIRENLKWRQEKGIKELAGKELDAELEALCPYFLTNGIGGRPVAYFTAAVDMADVLENFGKKRKLGRMAQVLAKQENSVHEFDKTWTGSVEDLPPERSMGCCIICDMDGYSIKQNSSVKVLQYLAECAKMVVNYFPAAGHVAIVINATKLIEIPLQIMKPIISGRLEFDIHGKDEDDVTVVSEVLTPEQLRDLQAKAKEMLGRH